MPSRTHTLLFRHREQFKVNFRQFVSQKLFLRDVAPCVWQMERDVLDLLTAFTSRLFCTLGMERVWLFSKISVPACCSTDCQTDLPRSVCPVCKWIFPVRLTVESTYKRSRGSAASNVPLCLRNEVAIETKYLNIRRILLS